MPHGDNGRFLLHHLYPVLSRSEDTSIPFADFTCKISHIVILILKYKYKTQKLNENQWQIKVHLLQLSSINVLTFIQFSHIIYELISEKVCYWENQEEK